MKRRNDNHSPGPAIRELVPSSHQRSELRIHQEMVGGKISFQKKKDINFLSIPCEIAGKGCQTS